VHHIEATALDLTQKNNTSNVDVVVQTELKDLVLPKSRFEVLEGKGAAAVGVWDC